MPARSGQTQDLQQKKEKDVSSILHTLRGQDFRRQRNLILRESRANSQASNNASLAHPSSSRTTLNGLGASSSSRRDGGWVPLESLSYARSGSDSDGDGAPPPPPAAAPTIAAAGSSRDTSASNSNQAGTSTSTTDVSRKSHVPGPPPPASWLAHDSQLQPVEENIYDSPAWRAQALTAFIDSASMTFHDGTSSSQPFASDRTTEDADSTIPSLRDICLAGLISPRVDIEEERFTWHASYTRKQGTAKNPPVFLDLLEIIPPYVRTLIARYAAIHAPLSTEEIVSLCDPYVEEVWEEDEVVVESSSETGHGGELIFSGPSIKPSAVLKHLELFDDQSPNGAEWDASPSGSDSSHSTESTDLTRLALLSTPFTSSILSLLPLTLTHLALLNLPTNPNTYFNITRYPPLHHLPSHTPLLRFLDLSYNPWLAGSGALGKIAWDSWWHLRYLGLVGTGVERDEEAQRALSKRMAKPFRMFGKIVVDGALT